MEKIVDFELVTNEWETMLRILKVLSNIQFIFLFQFIDNLLQSFDAA